MDNITAPKIKTETIIRTICLVLALFNQVMTALGKPVLDLGEEQLTQFFTALLTILVAIITWWKNNSFTPEARMGDEYMEHLREEKDEYYEQHR